MGGFSLVHILVVAALVVILFGGNRISTLMGDVAKGIKSFKKGMQDDDEPKQKPGEPWYIDDEPSHDVRTAADKPKCKVAGS